MNSSTTSAPEAVASSTANTSPIASAGTSPISAKPASSTKTAAKKAVSPRKSARKPAQKAATKTAVKPAGKPTAKPSVKATSTPANKSASKAPAKPVTKPVIKSAEPAASPAQAKTAAEQKLKKPKLVRDSFTFPKDEYQAIATLKQRALSLQHSTKKSEILRAGLKLMSSLNDKAFLAALTSVPALKTGRPAKS